LRSDHQNTSFPSFVTYQLVGSLVDGPISTNVFDVSRATIRAAPLMALTSARYALFAPRVKYVT